MKRDNDDKLQCVRAYALSLKVNSVTSPAGNKKKYHPGNSELKPKVSQLIQLVIK